MQPLLQSALDSAQSIILGKSHQIRLALACLLARGHLLIEDIPGVGKTTLAQTLSQTLGLDYNRVQFTSDLLPADVLGVNVFENATSTFEFHPGPIFAQLILADEVNRASPKAQSALLEAMEEHQVTIDGVTRPLPQPFFVIATQNPEYQIGTFPLPESQLDRFLMCLELGYPSESAELTLLEGRERRDILAELKPSMNPQQLIELQASAASIHTSDALIKYILALVNRTRESPWFINGLSPRAGLALRRCAQAWAMLEGRAGVLPEDVQAVFVAVTAHRLRGDDGHQEGEDSRILAQRILEAVPVD